MIVMETDRLVDDYMRRLEAAAAHLQRSRRAELVAEIREHIEAALRQEDTANEVAVRNVLERLGPPEEIVEAAEPPPSESPARAGKLEIAALIALVVPFLGWIVGAVLVVASRAWSGKEKALGITLALLPVLLPALNLMSGMESNQSPVIPDTDGNVLADAGSDSTTNAELLVWLGLLLGGLPSAFYLGWRLRSSNGARGR